MGHVTHEYSHGYTCEYLLVTRTRAQPYIDVVVLMGPGRNQRGVVTVVDVAWS